MLFSDEITGNLRTMKNVTSSVKDRMESIDRRHLVQMGGAKMKDLMIGLAVGAIAGMAVAATPKAQKLIGEAKRKVAEKAGQMKSDGCGCGCGMNE